MSKFFIIAGEASGDMHGANLVKEISKQRAACEFTAWGGDRLEAENVKILKHYRELAFMGFVEVLMNIRTILKNIKLCKSQIKAFKPDALILIDYPGFNMRIAKWAKAENIKVLYYISPQVWAWKKKRVFKLKETVDQMYAILPFEKDFYAKYGMNIEFVGHPLLDEITQKKTDKIQSEKPIVALLPGSRRQEIKRILPIMLEGISNIDSHQITIGMAPSIPLDFYRSLVKNPSIELVAGRTYDLLNSADMALVTSGTATLETALFSVPQVVCYKGNFISYIIAKNLIDLKFISLVNLIMDKEIVTELIQNECNPENISRELELLKNEVHRKQLLSDYEDLKVKLGNSGASKLTAHLMLKSLDKQN